MGPPTDILEAQAAEREQRRERAKRELKQLLADEGLAGWMRMRRNVHSYSLLNQVLISLQAAEQDIDEPYMPKSKGRWRKDGYHPAKGSKGLYIWVFCSRRRKASRQWYCCSGPVTGGVCEKCGRKDHYFKLAPVFVAPQVRSFDTGEPPPPPPQPAPLEGDSPGALLFGTLERWLWDEHGVPVSVCFPNADETLAGGAKGYWHSKERRIVISNEQQMNGQLATLVHEAVHALGVNQRDTDELDYKTAEAVTEATAYCVCQSIGLDTGARSAAYVAGWDAAAPETLERYASLIDRTARPIEQALIIPDPGKETP